MERTLLIGTSKTATLMHAESICPFSQGVSVEYTRLHNAWCESVVNMWENYMASVAASLASTSDFTWLVFILRSLTLNMLPQDTILPICSNMPASAADAEQDMVVGYPKLAGLMGRLPQLGIFRRFGALNAQNLLYLQAELTKLAFELRQQEKADAQEEKYDRKKFRLNWQVLSESADSDDFEATEQYNLFLKIRPKLKEYSKSHEPSQ